MSLGLTVTMPELEQADLITIAGCDLTVEHPIIGLRVKKLIQRRVPVYFIGSRNMYLGRFEVRNIRAAYGKETEAIMNIINLKNNSGSSNLPDNIKTCLINDLGKAKNIHILSGADLLNSPDRSSYLNSLKELGGALKAQLSVLITEANYLGVRLCGNVNSNLNDIIENIETGKIKTLFVAGGDPINVYPDRNRITQAFKKLDYLIYWGAFKNSTAEMAALVFPSLLPTENEGSYLNVERRLQFMQKPYIQQKGVTSLVQLFTDIKTELSGDLYYSAAEVFDKLAVSIPELSSLKYEKSEGFVIPSTDINDLRTQNKTESNNQGDFPFKLTFAKSVYYGGSGITSKSDTLQKLTPPQLLIMKRETAEKYKFESAVKVKLEANNKASGEFELALSDDIEPGCLLLFGYSEENPPNKFMTGYNKSVFARLIRVKE